MTNLSCSLWNIEKPLTGSTLLMRWHQSVPMMLTTSNLKNATIISHALNHAIKQTQVIMNQRSLIISANFLEKMAALSHDVVNDKVWNIVKSIVNLDKNMMLNPNLLHRKCLKSFSNSGRIYRTNLPPILTFPHKPYNRSSLQSSFQYQIFVSGKDPLHMIVEIDIISLLTIVIDLPHQAIVTLLLAIDIIQNITRALLLHNKNQRISFEFPPLILIHFL